MYIIYKSNLIFLFNLKIYIILIYDVSCNFKKFLNKFNFN